MAVHAASESVDPVSAGIAPEPPTQGPPDVRGLAAELHFTAAVRGLTEELVICGKQRGLHLAAVEEDVDTSLRRWLPRLSAASTAALGAGFPSEDELRSLSEFRKHCRAQKETDHRRRFPRRSSEVSVAAEALTTFVQARLRAHLEDPETHGLEPPELLELISTQSHAFEALWRPREGYGDARRLLLRVSNGQPLTVCSRCRSCVADNPSLHGRMRRVCPACER